LWTPFQEIWVNKNLNFFKQNWILVMNVGGLFDFWVGFEKRAPKLVRKLNWEWAWRLLQNPKKNWQKVKDSIKLLKYLIK
jgi:N-acetylglucosaminyldiphosphoundecaprenol N-acetyl-beta-D-mannosaminyltransferase